VTVAEPGQWARALLDAFAQAGVRHVVISPGSRSTPFVVAAAAHPGLVCHDVLDERSAAFFALGQARATGVPSLLLCTSGTAPAHYYPAVMEAAQAFVPLIVLSADRPFDRLGCGANQTVDQAKLFGGYVRHFADLGTAGEGAPEAARRAAVQAVHWARGPTPGPVHINVHARKPLEPSQNASPIDVAAPITSAYAPEVTPSAAGIQAAAEVIRSARRGVVVAGPAPLSQARCRDAVVELARHTGFVLCAEAASQLRFMPAGGVAHCDGFDWLWRTGGGRARWTPDVILQLGAAPVSAGYEALIEGASVRRVVIAPHGWPDPSSRAEVFMQAPVGAAVEALRVALPGPATSAWPALVEADGIVWRCVRDVQAGAEGLGEAAVAAEVVDACRGRALLAVGNSLPIRHLDSWVRGDGAAVDVVSQRGASGIDGLVSGAAGLAQAQERPVVLLLGDVSFLHDVGGLLAARHAAAPLVVVVINNGGGRIFEQLPVAARDDLRPHLDHFVTPQDARLEHAARLYGHRYVGVGSSAELRDALREGVERPGCTVVEAVVAPHGAAVERARAQAAVERALGGGT
jgi:2-succinyl-5-enolpyruvyl-6-hydroxy-3-cyclohexene-1-carboxylate synthase